jgi:uncharacterized membrane protein
MKKIFLTLLLVITLFFPLKVLAQSSGDFPKEEYFKAVVSEITDEGKVISENGHANYYQDLKIKVLDGNEKGNVISLKYGDPNTLTKSQEVSSGQQIILLKTTLKNKSTYSIYDTYRLTNILLILLFFFILIVAVARLKGVGSAVGLLFSLSVILFFIVPYILKGYDPLFISVVGSLIILFVTTYMAHGVSRQSTSALFSTFITLVITVVLALSFTEFAKIAGLGNEDIAALQAGATNIINLKGLFLGGVIIGTLGALNDVTTTQAATVFEILNSDKTLKYASLVKKSFNVGREHILSLVNTLILAYAGSSLFIFIFLVLNPGKVPYWVILNTETISDEIVSAVVGSSGLILAVPIVTLLASFVALKFPKKNMIK